MPHGDYAFFTRWAGAGKEEPGDVLFFDALTPHRSGPNNSPGSRRVLYLTYNRLSEGDHSRAYFRDKRISLSAQEGPLTNK